LRLRHADQLDADLVKLAKAALLRSLIAEHRAAVEEFERHVLGEAVGDHRTNHAGSVLWPQRDFLAAAVGEGVHLLGNDVGVLADRSRENVGELENRRRHFGEAIELGRGPRSLDHPAVAPRHLGEKILSTADPLQGAHTKFPRPFSAENRSLSIIYAKMLLVDGPFKRSHRSLPRSPPASSAWRLSDKGRRHRATRRRKS